MADKIIRDVYLNYDKLDEIDLKVIHHLSECKISAARIIVDVNQKLFNPHNGKYVLVLRYRISIDTEDLVWIKLTEPTIVFKEVSTSL